MGLNPKHHQIKPENAKDASNSSGSKEMTDLSQRPDPEIWGLFKKNNNVAFIHIYSKYFGVLYNYGLKMGCDEDLIKDCIHDVFAKISESKKRLSILNIKLYLLKSFRTRFFYYQKRNRKFIQGTSSHKPTFGFTISAEQKIINSQLDAEKIARLNQAIAALPERQRRVIYYFFYEELSVDDIKVLMEVTNRRTIQNLLYRAIGSLKQALIN